MEDIQIEEPAEPEQVDAMITIQSSIVNKLIKRTFANRIVTSEFKREFGRALTLFILFVQSGVSKKRYGREQILEVLEREGLGRVANDFRLNKQYAEGEAKKDPSALVQS